MLHNSVANLALLATWQRNKWCPSNCSCSK